MGTMAFESTPSQARAIAETGGAVLVSAAAGSGKTRVLTERLVRRVTDPDSPVDIDRFLVITYTRAAAAELRERIMTELGRRSAAQPGDRRLRRQQALCFRAEIGTIHSFCAGVVRENCHALGLPPAFRVIEEERAASIRQDVLTLLLEERYEHIDTDASFRLLSDTVGAGRDDRRLENAVLSLHDRLRSQPWPEDWARRQSRAFLAEGMEDAGETVWGAELMRVSKRSAERWAEAMEAAVAEMRAAGGAIEKAYCPSFCVTAEALRDLARALDAGWDRAVSFSDIPFPRLGALRNYDDPALREHVTAVREACKKAAEELRLSFRDGSAALLSEVRACAGAMDALLSLALELDARFTAEKRRRGCLDFSDLEHCANALLTERETGSPTPLALAWSARYEEVMVDEYQDVSPLQDRIFRAVSRQEQNLFLVGDVKQSIYRFRLADPSLFLEKYRSYAPAEQAGPGQPRRILLRENFRSRSEVLDAANAVFSRIMSRELGELDYDEDAALRYGATGYPEDGGAAVEFAVAEAGDEAVDGAPPAEKSEREARYVARRILEMYRAGTAVHSPEGARPCRWSDFVLLLRAPGRQGGVFRRVLAEHGIPMESVQGGGFFTSLEVTVAVNLLSLIDNPHADVPLISVLRSPAFCFSADALSAIRAGSPDTDFCTAVRAAAERGDEKCAGFLAKLDLWRALAPDLSPDALLRRVCADTDLFAVCAAMRDGAARRTNLMRLLEYARSFTSGGYRGLFRFVAWLRALAEKGAEPAPSESGNAVRILSIHRSKGLEFPFVFLCGLDHQFNRSDVLDSVLLHPELGLGPKYVDPALGVEYPTLARRAVARRLTDEMLSEEVRVLYVAMTRARERLILTCSMKNAAQTLEKLRAVPLNPEVLRAAPSPARWLALAALADGGEHLRLITVEGGEGTAAEAETAEEPERASSGEDVYARLRRKLDFVYPHAGSVSVPSKLTATLLNEAEARQADPEAAPLLREAPPDRFRRPSFDRARSLTAAERGVATHAFLQYVDFSKTDSLEALRGELDRLPLSPEEKAAVDLGAVLRLFRSPLGRRMRAAREAHREFRFTLLADADAWFPEADAEDRLLLQGVVDFWFAEDGEITVVDYKTDRVRAEEVPARAGRYRPQLETYAAALRRITGLPVRSCVLWFLSPGAGFEIKSCE